MLAYTTEGVRVMQKMKRQRQRQRLNLEQLEDRRVPTTLNWTPLGFSTNWHSSDNWTDPNTGGHSVPTASDDLVFNSDVFD
jgi:hypothetical protein